ncbi:hypothetical protein EB796_008254 [Bugula neritina]|uniref:SMB domain-containing protein n=1 Tax=Bugula neritina TaxID=10212 RepID=A0A7J7K752_BUGNE|nr:hypothetical protein EB796_008254 [Bugula neritina]
MFYLGCSPKKAIIEQWPVTGTYTGITYSNMYCAICNGALNPNYGGPMGSFDPLLAIEFWTTQIYCTNDTIQEIEKNKFDIPMLQSLLKQSIWLEKRPSILENKLCRNPDWFIWCRDCWVKHVPTESDVHKADCSEYISKCPETYGNEEIRRLCEFGPVYNYRNHSFDAHFYRNMFCEWCWRESDELGIPNLIFPEFPTGVWLATVKPVLKNVLEDQLSDENFRIPNRLSHMFISWPNNFSIPYTYNEISLLTSVVPKMWDLGSIYCLSDYSSVCGELIVFPEATNSIKCSGPGCAYNHVQDLSNSCVGVEDFSYDPQVQLQRTFLWTKAEIAKYFSLCGVTTEYKNCECDQRCQYFGTCCQDFEVEMRDPDDRMDWVCHGLHFFDTTGTVVVTSCPQEASDEEKSQCSMGNVGEWSLYGWLVLDKNTRLTYKNIHCARCNKATNTTFWDVAVRCDQDELGNIIGECSFDSYTLSLDDSDYYYECLTDKIYKSKCPSMYSEWKLSKDCEWGPVSFVYYNNIVFRNYFCAICDPTNKLELSEIVTDNFLDDLFSISVQMSQLSYTKTIRLSSWQCCRRCAQDPEPVCSKINNSTGNLTWTYSGGIGK